MLAAATAPLSFVLSARTAFTGTRYAKSHEYIKAEGNGVGRVGISDYAQKALGDLVFVELPAVGAQKKRGVCGTNTHTCTCMQRKQTLTTTARGSATASAFVDRTQACSQVAGCAHGSLLCALQ